MSNDAARKKTSELISDRGGRSFDSHGHGRHTMTREKSAPRQHASQVFARDIVARIKRGLHDGSCRDYALVAPPRMLGTLREALGPAGIGEPYLTIDKDVVQQDAGVIKELVTP